ncbi:MAG: hexosaminidase [Frankiaceae bacterium]|nr:hexosaminidase [Frankiaceae bacterium]
MATIDAARTVVPAPTRITPGEGAPFTITADTALTATGDASGVAELFAAVLRPSTGFDLHVLPTAPGAADAGGIQLTVDNAAVALGDEGYELTVSAERVSLRARTAAGLFYGTQTLRQLLPPTVDSSLPQHRPWQVGATHIVDTPRYPWRGAMLDVARHFFPAADVLRYIDAIALYKMNVLHLHLSDDQGWRIAIDSRPRLTAIGGLSAVGGGPGGYFTKQDYKTIVEYAAARFITVIPEIDMPGHTNAALASYADLNCDGKAREPYTGIAVGFSSLCVDKEAVYTFIDDVFGELAAMTPGPYLHVGGDEVQTLTSTQYADFIERVQLIVAKHGKTLVGWEETVKAKLAPGSVVQYWNTKSNYAALLKDASAGGVKLVLSPADRTYLDMKYDDDFALGLEWAGRVSVERAYGWDPGAVIPGAAAGSVLGVEAPLWSETLTTIADVEAMAFPRLPAIAETGWSTAGRDWELFRARLAAQAPRWDVMGIAYHRAPGVGWP